jgi:hypothetical protein
VLLIVVVVPSEVGSDTPVLELGGGLEEGVKGGAVALEDLEEPGRETRRSLRQKSVGRGVDGGVIRDFTRALAAGEAFDLRVIVGALADPARAEVDPIFHGDFEIRGLIGIGHIPEWRLIFVVFFFLIMEDALLESGDAVAERGLGVFSLCLSLGDGGAVTICPSDLPPPISFSLPLFCLAYYLLTPQTSYLTFHETSPLATITLPSPSYCDSSHRYYLAYWYSLSSPRLLL